MRTNRVVIGILTAVCLTALLTLTAAAQGRYANVYSRNDVSNFIRNLENSSDVFSREFNRRNTTNNERRIVSSFENAVDRLRRNFDRTDTWWQSRNDVQSIMDESQQVNQLMNNERFARVLEVQWRNMRRDINKLADTFDLPGIGGGGWNGGGNPGGWSGGQTSTPPTWARGTFYSANSADNITLTIGGDGRVTAVNNGETYYGTYYRNRLNVNNDTSDVSQSGNGIRTYNRSTGQTTVYSRNPWNGGGGGWNGGGGGNASRPPSWAQGTFRSTNASDITLTISGDGRVSVFSGGQTYYGTFYNNTITLNGDTSTVTQTRRGITTYNQRTGETTNYRR